MSEQARERMADREPVGLAPGEFNEKVRFLKRDEDLVIVVLHAFSGARRRCDVEHYTYELADEHGVPIFYFGVDLAFNRFWGLADPSLIAMLSDMIGEGLIDIVIGAPPCAAWSRARFQPGGPRPLRFRSQPLGRLGLTDAERVRVQEANVLLFNLLGLCDIAEGGREATSSSAPRTWRRGPFRASGIWRRSRAC